MRTSVLATSLRVGLETLRANPLRTILSTLGIIIGVAALVSVLSVGDGMERLAREQIGRTTDLQRIQISPRLFRIVDGTRPFRSRILRSSARLTPPPYARGTRRFDSGQPDGFRGQRLVTTALSDTTPHATQVQGLLAQGPVDGRLARLSGRSVLHDQVKVRAARRW